jgi:glycosyltransferase involved in cell wall biosynthesis
MSKSVLDDLSSFDNKKPRTYSPHPLYDHYGERISKQQACSTLNLDPSQRYVLFFGFIRGYKGLDLLLDAFADKRLKDLGVKLIVAGEFYGNEDAYMKQIKDLQIEDRVELHTYFIPDEKVNNYFCAADIVAQPYKTATQSGVTQIAFHFEKSMLVTNVGGLPEIVPHGKIGYVVEPNAGDIADALVDFYENDRVVEYEINVKEEKQKYAWSNMIKAFNDLAETIS